MFYLIISKHYEPLHGQEMFAFMTFCKLCFKWKLCGVYGQWGRGEHHYEYILKFHMFYRYYVSVQYSLQDIS